MIEKVFETIEKYNLISNGDKIVLAVSGGPDSLSMLNVLYEIKKNGKIDFDIFVAHVNHMIRQESTSEEEFVKDFCEKLNIQCFVKRIDVIKYANNNKVGTEEAGRTLRYEFFEEVLQKTNANKIAIAHNKNDNVETIIMNLLRGSGVSGLRGIEPIRNNKFIRPLIEIDRTEIESYCKNNNLEPKIDKSNFENIYTRNKIRNVVIPYIKEEFNPNIIETITRLSDVITDEDIFLKELTEEKYKEILIEKEEKEIRLDLKKFNLQNKVIKNRLVLHTISQLMGSTKGIEKIHIEDIIKLCSNNVGNKYLLPNKNLKVLVKNKTLYFISLL